MDNVIKYGYLLPIDFIFAVFYLVGKSYSRYGDVRLILHNYFQVVWFVFGLVGMTVFIHNVFSFLEHFIEMQSFGTSENTEIFNWKKCSLVMLVAWTPFVIAFFPGAIPWDTVGQIKQYLGLEPGFSEM